jgi:hypothetical protein
MIDKEKLKIFKWFARISSSVIILLTTPFYFGYGNPLPFTNSEYTLVENFGLTAFPIILLGLLLG